MPDQAHSRSIQARMGVRLRQLALLLLGSLLLVTVILASPLGRTVDRALSIHFAQMNQRREHNHLTRLDVAECQVLYNSIALAGRLVSPEGGAIVWHYLHGHGTDLRLNASYLKTSPVIQRSLNALKLGQSRVVSLRQAEDRRLSYALNPFSLRRGEHEVLLWQRIEFSTKGIVKTKLDYGLGVVELPDALIHALHPVPFMVCAEWRI